MNGNIEVINKNLWAVKFSLIPFIQEIHYEPADKSKPYSELALYTDDGVVILNKEHQVYMMSRPILDKAMRMPFFKVQKCLKKLEKIQNRNPMENMMCAIYRFEITRRKG